MAESLFQAAKKLASNGQLEQACKKFEESFDLDPTLGTKLHSATCYEELGRTASAWAAFSEAAAMAQAAGDKSREALANERVANLSKRLPKLTIEVPASVDGLRVELDGQHLASFNSALAIDPGPHEIRVSAPGYEPWSTKLTVAKGAGTDTLSVPKLKKLSDASTHDVEEVRDSTDEAPSAQRNIGYVVGGVGLVALAAGGYFGLQAQSKAKDADAHCSGTYCSQEGLDGHDDAKQSALFSSVGFGLGVAGVATGVVLILTAPSASERAAWVAPYASERGGGLSAGARF